MSQDRSGSAFRLRRMVAFSEIVSRCQTEAEEVEDAGCVSTDCVVQTVERETIWTLMSPS